MNAKQNWRSFSASLPLSLVRLFSYQFSNFFSPKYFCLRRKTFSIEIFALATKQKKKTFHNRTWWDFSLQFTAWRFRHSCELLKPTVRVTTKSGNFISGEIFLRQQTHPLYLICDFRKTDGKRRKGKISHTHTVSCRKIVSQHHHHQHTREARLSSFLYRFQFIIIFLNFTIQSREREACEDFPPQKQKTDQRKITLQIELENPFIS